VKPKRITLELSHSVSGEKSYLVLSTANTTLHDPGEVLDSKRVNQLVCLMHHNIIIRAAKVDHHRTNLARIEDMENRLEAIQKS